MIVGVPYNIILINILNLKHFEFVNQISYDNCSVSFIIFRALIDIR